MAYSVTPQKFSKGDWVAAGPGVVITNYDTAMHTAVSASLVHPFQFKVVNHLNDVVAIFEKGAVVGICGDDWLRANRPELVYITYLDLAGTITGQGY